MPREVTSLTPEEEAAFRQWTQQNQIGDVDHPDSFYDYRGFWKEHPTYAHEAGQHFTDKYKQHGHPSFSIESQYSAGPFDGGRWEGETYVPPAAAKRKAESDDLLFNALQTQLP